MGRCHEAEQAVLSDLRSWRLRPFVSPSQKLNMSHFLGSDSQKVEERKISI